MSTTNSTVTIIYIAIIVLIFVLLILCGIAFYMWWRNKKKRNGEEVHSSTGSKSSSTRLQGIESMSKFIAFDKIVDNMIVRKKGEQYVMVIHCKGVNYDLLGEEEKIAVENGFVQFLNILRFPIQLYVQTRSLNLKGNIDQYESKINEVRDEIMKLESHIKKETENGRMDLVRKLELERRRKMNILEYGADITNYVSRMSQNRNVLQQNTFVVLSYFKAEFGGEVNNYSPEEIENVAFSELYTRAQTVIRGLSSAGVTGRVMESEELAELLYVAYNRDDSELINIRRSVDAQYDSLYNSAKDVFEKQKEIIESKIDKEAIDLTANSIKKADKDIREFRKNNQKEIKKRALQYVEAYKNEMTNELYDRTKQNVENADLTEDKTTQENKKAKLTENSKNEPADAKKVATRTRRIATNAERTVAQAGEAVVDTKRAVTQEARKVAAEAERTGAVARRATTEANNATTEQRRRTTSATKRVKTKNAEV